jgi:hypothetical protein
MTTVSATVEHPSRRLIVHPSRPYDADLLKYFLDQALTWGTREAFA